MPVLVTGGTGFVGLSVSEALAAGGREVILFAPDELPAAFACLSPFHGMPRIAGDVRSAGDLARAFGEGIAEVVHLAAVTPGPEREARDPGAIVGVNLGGTVAVVQAAAEAGVRRVVVVGSVAAYGDAEPAGDGRLHEDACPRPRSLYGISKLAAEQAALRLGDVLGLDVRAVRLGPVFGPWERVTGVRDLLSPHAQVLACAAEGRPALLQRALRADWLYARDAAAGIAAVLGAPALEGRVFNLGGGVVTGVGDWCTALQRHRQRVDWRVAEPGENSYGHSVDPARPAAARQRPPCCRDRFPRPLHD